LFLVVWGVEKRHAQEKEKEICLGHRRRHQAVGWDELASHPAGTPVVRCIKKQEKVGGRKKAPKPSGRFSSEGGPEENDRVAADV